MSPHIYIFVFFKCAPALSGWYQMNDEKETQKHILIMRCMVLVTGHVQQHGISCHEYAFKGCF